jgi:dTDP-4-dehydrorhamnose reductase
MPFTVLVTGASGFLGAALRRTRDGRFDLIGAGRRRPAGPEAAAWRPLDLLDEASVRAAVEGVRPHAVLHAAASQRDPELDAVVVEGTRRVAGAARDAGALLCHVSTDMVFDGEAAPYHEGSARSPNTDYGRAKGRAEEIVLASGERVVVVRTSLLFAPSPDDPRTRALVERLARREPVTLFTDEVRCPVLVDDFARALWRLLGDALGGAPALPRVAHLAGPEPMTRFAFGTALLRALGSDLGSVRSGTIAESGLARPRDLTLVSPATPPSWREPLRSPRQVLAG